jgi:hypothetical protein
LLPNSVPIYAGLTLVRRAKIRLYTLPFKASPLQNSALLSGPSGDASRNNGQQQRTRFCWAILLSAEVPICHLGKTIHQSLAQ